MHRYIPHTEKEINEMLKEIGINSIEELYINVPKTIDRYTLEDGKDEFTVKRELIKIANKNKVFSSENIFAGAGIYTHYIPAIVENLANNQKFVTAYTPYQAEVSQGTLQALFEYQTMMCELTGMEVANSSMYDGATALAEAILMAVRVNRKNKVLIASSISPEYIQTSKTYCTPQNILIEEVKWNNNGTINFEDLKSKIDENTTALVVGYPNFFGIVEDLKEIRETIPEKVMLIVVSEPVSLAILEAPGKLGADIVVGEGQALGITPNFGGPGIGFFTTLEKYIRKMPGRIIGETKDVDGKIGYVMVLQTREQHIRRAKATSNICSNHALMALTNAIYLSAMGPKGLREVAKMSYNAAHYLAEKLKEKGYSLIFDGPFFNEFVFNAGENYYEKWVEIAKDGVLGPIPLDKTLPNFKNCALACCTEVNTKESIDNLLRHF
ncbi:glycine dehydrogenase [Thermosipho melanesiensis]|uniref:Probable glycine dehydrogenase (decarboxylating) subunit 1 n=2 Tax=Thermosipho melanesiensis TaxID=46541 RepID=A6LP68_THEM4|nr:aminomethyl-transferring glycine dehydrogenase subunit GcvPA [Thermosipho melanesiensis]ABR31719.1 Glycine dehydrogenase (decarboxylating) [Thermosipho melanesiensis BI429]APT74741.1 glycine dehydrogenase [Thermosipho melanesiensis]OOC35254.1 glycine dehydrogenase [Thermosipho melanesiensis]OOC35464.1 glycine dehydrogenase [Thermosipho melanesiensis]OOC36705.1 glycine dehydrogenase [Thermosipho melanesiensis]